MTIRFPAYLAFTNPVTLLRILRNNGGFDARYTVRVIVLFLVSVVMLPFNALEWLLFQRRIDQTQLSDSPLIILGHDRSGTTHLLNLLSLDPQFAYTRPSQMVLPGCCILFDKVMDTLLGFLDYRRPFDNMEVGPGSPQDDEVPLVKLTPHAQYHKYSFPRHYRFWLDTYVFKFSSASPQYAQWKKVYLGTLKKAAVLMGKNRSLLKSPATMANLNVVLELFPNAKFIHIKRNPYKVLPSQINLHQTMVNKYALEAISDEEIREFALYQYEGYMHGYLQYKHLIPRGNLVEIRYEDFVQDRLQWLGQIYAQLELGDFDSRRASLEAYLSAIENYAAHQFNIDPALKMQIDARLGFAFTAMGYTPA
jgi:omega-hydroxy-beta-dihydromenaquinone-9 sulfotransferase